MRRVLLAVVAAALACRPSRDRGEFRLRIALVGPLKAPIPDGEPSATIYAQEWVFQPLLRTAPDGSAISGLAARFQFSSPARVVVELREGAKFSDGSAVTTEDVRRSLRDVGLEVREQPRGLLIESPSGTPVEPSCFAALSRNLERSMRSCCSGSPLPGIRSRAPWREMPTC